MSNDSHNLPDGFAPNPNVGKMVRSDRARSGLRKGKSGEREVLQLIVSAMIRVESNFSFAGHTVRRFSEEVKRNTLQSDRGGFDLHGIPLLAVEVKRCETLAIGTWRKQCQSQAKTGELPVLIYRQSKQPWRVQTWLVGPINREPKVWVWSEISIEDFLTIYARMYSDYLGSRIDG